MKNSVPGSLASMTSTGAAGPGSLPSMTSTGYSGPGSLGSLSSTTLPNCMDNAMLKTRKGYTQSMGKRTKKPSGKPLRHSMLKQWSQHIAEVNKERASYPTVGNRISPRAALFLARHK